MIEKKLMLGCYKSEDMKSKKLWNRNGRHIRKKDITLQNWSNAF